MYWSQRKSFLHKMPLNYKHSSRELTYSTWGKENHVQKCLFGGICSFPGGCSSVGECIFYIPPKVSCCTPWYLKQNTTFQERFGSLRIPVYPGKLSCQHQDAVQSARRARAKIQARNGWEDRIHTKGIASWWFQPMWNILVKLDHFPR